MTQLLSPSPARDSEDLKSSAATVTSDRVCVGVIVGVHGVRGAVRIKTFTAEPGAVGAYGPLADERGERSFRLRVVEVRGEVAIATLAEVADRNAAERLKGIQLYAPRAALPPPEEDEFYHADLIGLRAELDDGSVVGRVAALHNFGAGDVIEVSPEDGGSSLILPFTRDFVPTVDIAARRVVLSPPDEAPRAAEDMADG